MCKHARFPPSSQRFIILDDHVEIAAGQLAIATMHLAKGMEFRVVAVMACDDEIIPLQKRIEAVGDDADLQEVYDTERVSSCTSPARAQEIICLSAVWNRRRNSSPTCGLD